MLGGVSIPYEHSFVAHSDGDVLIHALIDALLGAAALGDIGQHFPDTDVKWEGANSRQLLLAVVAMIATKGYKLGNADITIVAQQPKMLPHLDKMRLNLSADMGCNIDQINIKATTTEELGFAGRKEGIACHAVALLVSS
jgi:2-C-methyl-D-erythritol 2,4-cyclodiphosphate synthase